MRYWTSDLHLGHARILELEPGRASAFTDLDEMNAGIVERITAPLRPGDELWNLGDLALGDLQASLACALPLAEYGHVLFAGNHDRFSPAFRASAEYRARFEAMYFDVLGLTDLYIGNAWTTICGIEVQVSHYPYAGDPSDRHFRLRPRDEGGWLICGHVHSAWRQRGRQINVGVDAWGGRPVSNDDLIALIAAGPHDLPALPWPEG